MTAPLPDVTRFLIDFNVHAVAAALGVPIPAEAEALLYGVAATDLAAYQAEIDAELAQTAQAFHAHRGITALSKLLPAGKRVLCIGDSITTYRRSYARLLEHLLAPHGIEVVNRGFSGYTSTHGLELTYTQFLSLQPDLVFIKYGVNDCKQFGGEQTLVSRAEYERNLTRIIAAFRQHTQARIVVLTPTPVVEGVVNANPDIQAMRLVWSNDVLRQFADAALTAALQAGVLGIDLWPVFGPVPDAALYCADGLHPNAAGQTRLLAHVLERISDYLQQG